MKQPQISVIVPVHNAARYLVRCIDSLLAQSYTDFEVVLVENGSKDDSAAICRTYAAASEGRIRLLELPTAGVSAARNAGIDAAEGHYLTFLDADDWAEPGYLAEFFRDTRPEAGTVVLQGILIDTSEHPTPKPAYPLFPIADAQIEVGGDNTAVAIAQRFLCDGCSAGKLYPTELIRQHGVRFPEEFSSHEDHVFFFRAMRHTDRVVWRKGCGMHYMCRGEATLSNSRHSAPRLIASALQMEEMMPGLQLRFGIKDPEYLFSVYDEMVLGTLTAAARAITKEDYLLTLRTVNARREAFRRARHRTADLLTPAVWRMLGRVSERHYKLVYYRMLLRRFSLHLRGRL